MRYLVSYDLTKPGRDYKDLIAAMQALRATRFLESVWVGKTNLDAAALREHIISQGKLDANDRILVVALTGAAAWRRLLVSDADAKKVLTE